MRGFQHYIIHRLKKNRDSVCIFAAVVYTLDMKTLFFGDEIMTDEQVRLLEQKEAELFREVMNGACSMDEARFTLDRWCEEQGIEDLC